MPSTQEIIAYLKANPSFFEEHEDLLADLSFGNIDGITPFYERQLEVLKGRVSRHQAKIEFIVDSVKSNQELELELLRVAIGLLAEQQNGESPVERVNELIKRQFNIEEVVTILKSDADACQVRHEAVYQRVMHKASVCDDRLSSALRESIFGRGGQSLQSCAFVPLLFEDELLGVMVLGSDSGTRFEPEVGVMFLDRLGLLIGGYIQGRPGQP